MAEKTDVDETSTAIQTKILDDELRARANNRLSQICELLDLPQDYFSQSKKQVSEEIDVIISNLLDKRMNKARTEQTNKPRVAPSKIGRLGILALGKEDVPKGPLLAAHIAKDDQSGGENA